MSPIPARPAQPRTCSTTARRGPRRRQRSADVPRSMPTWLRAVAAVCAATSRARATPMEPMPAPALAPTLPGALPPAWVPAWAPAAAVGELLPDPSLEDFLAGVADAGACHWGLDGTEIWGPEESVLKGNGSIKAYEIRALGPDEQDRAAALGSILGQAPERLRAFARAVGNATEFTLQIPGGHAVTTLVRNTVALYANGTRAAYTGCRGLLAPLARKLALGLATQPHGPRFNTSANVFDAVLGNSMEMHVPEPMTLADVLTTRAARPLFATLAPNGGFNNEGESINTDTIDFSGPTMHFQRGSTLDITTMVQTYGLLGADPSAPTPTVLWYNPLGDRGPVDPPPGIFLGNASILVQRMPLHGIANGIVGELTTAS